MSSSISKNISSSTEQRGMSKSFFLRICASAKTFCFAFAPVAMHINIG